MEDIRWFGAIAPCYAQKIRKNGKFQSTVTNLMVLFSMVYSNKIKAVGDRIQGISVCSIPKMRLSIPIFSTKNTVKVGFQ